jgi:SAM-dependent methyltransferase
VGLLQRNRQKLETAKKPYLKYFSPVSSINLSLNRACLLHFSRGRLLDGGAGHLRNQALASGYCDEYESMDVAPVSENLNYICDIQEMTPVPSGRYDTVLLTHVLEHLPRPGDALKECFRVLNSEGTLIGSTPHLSRLHGEPHDYFRFTKHGLAYLLEEVAGFKQWAIFPAGGLLSFLGHQFSTLLVCSTLQLPVVGAAVARLNYSVLVRLILGLDRRVDSGRRIPCMYFFIASRGEFSDSQTEFIKSLPGAICAGSYP